FLVLAAGIGFGGGAFWYYAARDRKRRHRALAYERELCRRLADVGARLAAGSGTDVRREALADLAEWVSLRSRRSGRLFDLDMWRQFTAVGGTPVAVVLGMQSPPAERLAPVHEEIDLEQESPG